jgi:hypothetical protein
MRFGVAIPLLISLLAAGSAAGQGLGGRARIQIGQEYDTNSWRTYSPNEPDELARIVIEGSLRYGKGSQRLSLSYHGGFKAFYHQTAESLVATSLAAVYRWSPGENWLLGARINLYDTTMKVHDRDYFLARGELFARRRISRWLELECFLGGRYFLFKPDDSMDYSLKLTHAGPLAGARLYIRGSRDVSAVLQYGAELRLFGATAQMLKAGAIVPADMSRLDIRHSGSIRVRQRIRYAEGLHLIIEAAYTLSVNDTNSYGSAAHWHRLSLLLSAQLPYDFTLHLMGTLQFSGYLDGIYVEGDLYDPDADENENSFIVRLSYQIWGDLSVFVHGAVYRNDFQSRELDLPSFRRETVMAGLAYDLTF